MPRNLTTGLNSVPGERPHGAKVDDVARELRHEHLLDVHPDLHLVAPPRRAQVLAAGDLGGESHAPRALDAPRHDRLDERAHVLVLDGALPVEVDVGEAGAVRAEGHRLQRIIT